eukprot:TRINITY_DN64203_c0_g1_i1.p1 TRINITY_DN64203_c0_g1~~TRINITY_DN64203_c0_g1_i1.p1  ORF type:complete len:398 (+),score=97.32 TRINITY_DN64203_c0_g1_i1:31-1224(+)
MDELRSCLKLYAVRVEGRCHRGIRQPTVAQRRCRFGAAAAAASDGSATATAAAGSFSSEMARLCTDVAALIEASPPYALQDACRPSERLRAQLRAVADGTAPRRDSDWHGVASLRIGDSWRSREAALIWLDDKVAQVEMTRELCGEQLHLPLLAHARAGDAVALESAVAAARTEVRAGRPLAVKPRHGANAASVFLWTEPLPGDAEDAVAASVEVAARAEHHSWAKENWQLSQVPRGVVVQPLYRPSVRAHRCENLELRPLELRVLVPFGVVIGATLTAFPFELWVTRDGIIQLWDSADLRAAGVRASQKHGRRLGADALELLREALARDWPRICSLSERLVRAAGLDELRVDWLVGDETWGSRIGELTYMGTGGSISLPMLSEVVAKSYASRMLDL